MENIAIAFGKRLREARISQGLSMEELCKKMHGVVSKQSISKYELGKSMPDSTNLLSLCDALSVKPDYFFWQSPCVVSNVDFYSGNKMAAKEANALKMNLRNQVEVYTEIETICNKTTAPFSLHKKYGVRSKGDAIQAAQSFRMKYGLGDQPISNVVSLLEELGIMVVEIDWDGQFSAMASIVNGERPVIALQKDLITEKKRFYLLHELAHLVLNFEEDTKQRLKEDVCDCFSLELLLPEKKLTSALDVKRHDISMIELQQIQKLYGVSIDSIMYKAKESGIISPKRYNTFLEKVEQQPQLSSIVNSSTWTNVPTNRFKSLVYSALSKDLITQSKAAVLLNVPVNEVMNENLLA